MSEITLVMMCCFLTFHVQGCQVNRLPGRRDRNRYLDHLLENSNGNVFIESTAKFKSNMERHTVLRPRSGGRLELTCHIRNTMDRFADRITMSQYPVWTQDGVPLDGDILKLMPKEFYSCRYAADVVWSAHFSKSFNRTTGIHSLFLENIAQYHAGEYECSGHSPEGFVLLQKYAISPILAARDVFDPQMVNVSARIGDTVQLRCFVKFDQLTGSFNQRFMWRHEDYILSAPGVAMFQSAIGGIKGFEGNVKGKLNSTYGCHSVLTIRTVDQRHAGSYQCWFKIDDNLGEWVVQSVYLTVLE